MPADTAEKTRHILENASSMDDIIRTCLRAYPEDTWFAFRARVKRIGNDLYIDDPQLYETAQIKQGE
jgi:hypothetical protein